MAAVAAPRFFGRAVFFFATVPFLRVVGPSLLTSMANVCLMFAGDNATSA